ncbi:MAG: SDR family NAD(P)-dependent oxidoreductase [Alphaproteobacteria bacterium]
MSDRYVQMEARTAIVTGGSSGIGLAVVSRLAATGHKVAFFGSSAGKVEKALHRLDLAGMRSDVMGEAVDIRSASEIQAFVEQVGRRLGPPTILVHSAGMSPKREGERIAVHDTPLDQWQEVLEVNLTGAFLCTRQMLPIMVDRRFGRIVMIGSQAARALPRFAGAAYVASKAGLAGFVRSLAAEYASAGITANTVAPGNIATEMTGGRSSPQNLAAVSAIPAGRIGETGDVAGIVAFLCSPEAGFINGATVDVTGAEFVAP